MNELKQSPLQEEGCKTSSLLNKERFDIHWQYLNSSYKSGIFRISHREIQTNLKIPRLISQQNFVPSKRRCYRMLYGTSVVIFKANFQFLQCTQFIASTESTKLSIYKY